MSAARQEMMAQLAEARKRQDERAGIPAESLLPGTVPVTGPRMTAADQLAAIEARADAATEGPWEWTHLKDQPRQELLGSGRGILRTSVLCHPEQPDAEFIAHARTDVPALLALVRERDAAIERVKKLHRGNRWGYCEACSEHVNIPMPCPTVAALTATEGA